MLKFQQFTYSTVISILNALFDNQPKELPKFQTEDILHRVKQTNQCSNLDFTQEMYNLVLVLIEDLCILISNLPHNHYGMPSPDRPATRLVSSDLQREK